MREINKLCGNKNGKEKQKEALIIKYISSLALISRTLRRDNDFHAIMQISEQLQDTFSMALTCVLTYLFVKKIFIYIFVYESL